MSVAVANIQKFLRDNKHRPEVAARAETILQSAKNASLFGYLSGADIHYVIPAFEQEFLQILTKDLEHVLIWQQCVKEFNLMMTQRERIKNGVQNLLLAFRFPPYQDAPSEMQAGFLLIDESRELNFLNLLGAIAERPIKDEGFVIAARGFADTNEAIKMLLCYQRTLNLARLTSELIEIPKDSVLTASAYLFVRDKEYLSNLKKPS